METPFSELVNISLFEGLWLSLFLITLYRKKPLRYVVLWYYLRFKIILCLTGFALPKWTVIFCNVYLIFVHYKRHTKIYHKYVLARYKAYSKVYLSSSKSEKITIKNSDFRLRHLKYFELKVSLFIHITKQTTHDFH